MYSYSHMYTSQLRNERGTKNNDSMESLDDAIRAKISDFIPPTDMLTSTCYVSKGLAQTCPKPFVLERSSSSTIQRCSSIIEQPPTTAYMSISRSRLCQPSQSNDLNEWFAVPPAQRVAWRKLRRMSYYLRISTTCFNLFFNKETGSQANSA